jgi:hypothetical protein
MKAARLAQGGDQMSFSQWWTFRESLIEYEHNYQAVYEFGDSSETVIYIGGAHELQLCLTRHFNEPADSCIKKYARRYRYEYTADYLGRELRLYDEHVAAYGKPPACNSSRPPGL